MGLKSIFKTVFQVQLFTQGIFAAPSPQSNDIAKPACCENGAFWMQDIQRMGEPAFGPDGFKIFRNVKDYGAAGDGSADDSDAINAAIAEGNRCGEGCDSNTVTPAIVYFPPGTYRVTKPIIQYYYTHLIGDATSRPVLKADPTFQGIAIIDSDPYIPGGDGAQWYTNQNNFFRQVRNFVLDVSAQPINTGTGIHWQVAQATSLQNIEFIMREDKSDANAQQGIFMENGSGGFMSDLTFTGGKFGGWFGNQQFTVRNFKFNNCKTAIHMEWNWAWTLHGVEINNAEVGIDMANLGNVNQVGSILLIDSKISNTPVGIATVYTLGSELTSGTLILDNVDMTENVPAAVSNPATQQVILAGNTKIESYVQGNAVEGLSGGGSVQGPQTPVPKPAALLDSAGKIVTRSKPQYEDVSAKDFVHVKPKAKGDGVTDDSDALQEIFDNCLPGQIVYFDHGAYVLHKTVRIPKNIKIVGEIWPLIMAGGDSFFKDMNNPKPLLQVGQPGDVGNVEMQDLMIETLGPQPGAILMEWNVAGTAPGLAGLWDVHFRVGGSAGTQLQSDKCAKTPDQVTEVNPECIGSFMLMHITETGSGYFENNWFWVSDHELDLTDYNQINIYNGRGVLIESTKGNWLWGTASEHNVMYNYQLTNAKNVYMGHIQSETAYFHSNPDATVPFPVDPAFSDPDIAAFCAGGAANCAKTFGFIAQNSSDVFVYGAGLYSFFENYEQTCLDTNNCQQYMVSLDEASKVHLYGLSTKAAFNMVTIGSQTAALDSENRNWFCGTLASFHS